MTHEDEQKIVTDIALIKQAILGNGVKGIAQRLNEVEEYINSHPSKCPMIRSRAQIWGVRAAEAGVIGVIFVGADIILRLAKVL